MNDHKLDKHMDDMCAAMFLLMEQKHKLPLLVLILATIDILGALSGEDEDPRSTGRYFREWADKYLLPDSGLNCTASDLWGARCGILHTYSPASDDSRRGRARQIAYAWDWNGTQFLEEQKRQTGWDGVVVGVAMLTVALVEGITRFGKAIDADPSFAQHVYDRAEHIMFSAMAIADFPVVEACVFPSTTDLASAIPGLLARPGPNTLHFPLDPPPHNATLNAGAAKHMGKKSGLLCDSACIIVMSPLLGANWPALPTSSTI